MFIQVGSCFCHAKLSMDVIVTFANLCELFTSFTVDVNMNLQTLSEPIKEFTGNLAVCYRTKKAKEFNGIIQFHAYSQQLNQSPFPFEMLHLILKIFFSLNLTLFQVGSAVFRLIQ